MTGFWHGVIVTVLIGVGWLGAGTALMAGFGYAIHRHDCGHTPNFDDDVDQALANVNTPEDADCRLWELECGWTA